MPPLCTRTQQRTRYLSKMSCPSSLPCSCRLLVTVFILARTAASWQILPKTTTTTLRRSQNILSSSYTPFLHGFPSPTTTTKTHSTASAKTVLQAQPTSTPPARQPRRKLQKRRRRREKQELLEDRDEDELWETAEVRPLLSFRSKELGEDYWIDEEDLQREQQRQASRPPDPGQIPKQKLWNEVLSPYKQNWIGIASVTVVVLATIVTKFPELLSPPTITIPDL